MTTTTVYSHRCNGSMAPLAKDFHLWVSLLGILQVLAYIGSFVLFLLSLNEIRTDDNDVILSWTYALSYLIFFYVTGFLATFYIFVVIDMVNYGEKPLKIIRFYMWLKLFSIAFNTVFIVLGLIFYPQIETSLFLKVFAGPIFILVLEVLMCLMVMSYKIDVESERISRHTLSFVKKIFFFMGCCGLISRPFGTRV